MLHLKSGLITLIKLREVYQSQLHPCDLRKLDDVIEAIHRIAETTDETEIRKLQKNCLYKLDQFLRAVTNIAELFNMFFP